MGESEALSHNTTPDSGDEEKSLAERGRPACTGAVALVPDSSKGPSPGPQGYSLEEIKPGIFWISMGGYDTMFLSTGEGVILIDAPPAMQGVLLDAIHSQTDEPIAYQVYSHSHLDHIGAAHMVPSNVTRVAHRETTEKLAKLNDFHRPTPGLSFEETGQIVLGNKMLELRYRGNIHQPGNIFIYEPQHKVLMLVDVIFPGWIPFRNLAVANDVHEFVNAHDYVLEYDFDVMVCGHLTRYGSRSDVETQREYVHCLRELSQRALATVRIENVAARTGTENLWALMGGYIDEMVEQVNREVLSAVTSDGRPWVERLAGADIWTQHNAFAMIQALRIERSD